MSLETNLKLAHETLAGVSKLLPFGSDNRDIDKSNPVRYAEAKRRIKIINEELSEDLDNIRSNRHVIKVSLLDSFRTQANYAKQYEAGNCGEQAVVGFFYLTETLKTEVRPISIVLISDDDDYPQHTIILIGAPDDADAVVCDPYENEAYPAKDFYKFSAQKWGTKLFLRLMLKDNDVCDPALTRLFALGSLTLVVPIKTEDDSAQPAANRLTM